VYCIELTSDLSLLRRSDAALEIAAGACASGRDESMDDRLDVDATSVSDVLVAGDGPRCGGFGNLGRAFEDDGVGVSGGTAAFWEV
jgi:hypothetical protein